MFHKITALCKLFVTLITLKWFFSCVNTPMPNEITAQGECFVTFVTFI
jgi:hypothetical protein